jgi:hypothetical protein
MQDGICHVGFTSNEHLGGQYLPLHSLVGASRQSLLATVAGRKRVYDSLHD